MQKKPVMIKTINGGEDEEGRAGLEHMHYGGEFPACLFGASVLVT